MWRTPIRRLRWVGFLEGVSYLVLLGIAMPLKYFAGLPLAVRIVGSVHGGLFILFFLAVADVARRREKPLAGLWSKAAIASVIPCGTFVFDTWLRQIEAQESVAAEAPQA
jgi:integral membrane protein